MTEQVVLLTWVALAANAGLLGLNAWLALRLARRNRVLEAVIKAKAQERELAAASDRMREFFAEFLYRDVPIEDGPAPPTTRPRPH